MAWIFFFVGVYAHLKTVQSYQTFTTGSHDNHRLPSQALFTASARSSLNSFTSGPKGLRPLTSHNGGEAGVDGVWETHADGLVGALNLGGQSKPAAGFLHVDLGHTLVPWH